MAGGPLFEIPEQLVHLIPTYCKELRQDGAHLTALMSGDRVELAEHAHAMGGKCAMFGDRELAEMLYEIEREAPISSDKVVKVLVTAVMDRVGAVLDSLER
jgi:HPt (histidine-containing phosphotransfer) domain-containing protein